jgi:hypothetical protein
MVDWRGAKLRFQISFGQGPFESIDLGERSAEQKRNRWALFVVL